MSDEYGVYFRPELALGTYRQARTMLAWRLGSMVLSIGLVELNPDGSSKLDANGKEIYTYTQEQVTALAAVLTGWNFDLAKA